MAFTSNFSDSGPSSPPSSTWDTGGMTPQYPFDTTPIDPNATPQPFAPGAATDTGTLTGEGGLNASLLKYLQQAGAFSKAINGSGGSGQNAFSMTNPDGSINWASLIPLIAGLGGGALASNATKTATNQMTGAINSANQQITGLLGPQGAQAGYQPYQTLGQAATGKLGAYQYQPLAALFPSAVAKVK